jgi:hypothetical protein
MHQVPTEVRNIEMRHPTGNSTEACAYGFDRQLQQDDARRTHRECDNRARNAVRDEATHQHDHDRQGREYGRFQRKRFEMACQDVHTLPEDARNLVYLQAEEVLDLGAGNEHGDAVGKADHDRPRNEFDRSPHAAHAHDDQENAGHHGAHEQAVHPVCRDDSGHDDDESASGTANLVLRAAQQRDQEARDDGAVDARLWRQAGSNRERHRQRQGHQAHCDSGNQITQKFVERVIAQTKDRLRKPTLLGPSNSHSTIMPKPVGVVRVTLVRARRAAVLRYLDYAEHDSIYARTSAIGGDSG